jgi:tRNA(adenine34) deaminase
MSPDVGWDPAVTGPEILDAWMGEALSEARAAAASQEVPVGAVVARLDLVNPEDPVGSIVGRGRDRRVEFNDPTAHAEVLALREAGQALGDWRIENCALIVTLEPCLMCAGATLLARVPLLVYGARNPKFGAVGGQMNTLAHPGWNHVVRVHGGVRAEESAALLKDFFGRLRTG